MIKYFTISCLDAVSFCLNEAKAVLDEEQSKAPIRLRQFVTKKQRQRQSDKEATDDESSQVAQEQHLERSDNNSHSDSIVTSQTEQSKKQKLLELCLGMADIGIFTIETMAHNAHRSRPYRKLDAIFGIDRVTQNILINSTIVATYIHK